MEEIFIAKLCIFLSLYPCISLFISPWLWIKKIYKWSRRVLWSQCWCFLLLHLWFPRHCNARSNFQVFCADSRQLHWKFSHYLFGCGGKHVNTWRDWDWDCLKAKARVFIQAWITTSYVQCLCIYDSWPFTAREKPPNLFYLPPRKRLCLNTMNRQCSGTNLPQS